MLFLTPSLTFNFPLCTLLRTSTPRYEADLINLQPTVAAAAAATAAATAAAATAAAASETATAATTTATATATTATEAAASVQTEYAGPVDGLHCQSFRLQVCLH